MLSYFLKTEEDTQKLAQRLAPVLKVGHLIHLEGPLGAGKTTFARYLIQALSPRGSQEIVTSPTFSLIQVYDHLTPPLWHFDLYRLAASKDIQELGLEEALGTAVTLVEWPSQLPHRPQTPDLIITFHLSPSRHVTLQGNLSSGLPKDLS